MTKNNPEPKEPRRRRAAASRANQAGVRSNGRVARLPRSPKSRAEVEGTCVALLRAVNVARRRPLRTQAFVRILEKIGLYDVRTYIQTGNAVFRAPRTKGLREKIQGGLAQTLGYVPEVLLLSLAELEDAVSANPFPRADAGRVHLLFLVKEPVAFDFAVFAALRAETEQFALHGRVFYFHAPDGVGRSRLFARAEKLLGVTATARNLRTVREVLRLAREIGGERDR